MDLGSPMARLGLLLLSPLPPLPRRRAEQAEGARQVERIALLWFDRIHCLRHLSDFKLTRRLLPHLYLLLLLRLLLVQLQAGQHLCARVRHIVCRAEAEIEVRTEDVAGNEAQALPSAQAQAETEANAYWHFKCVHHVWVGFFADGIDLNIFLSSPPGS